MRKIIAVMGDGRIEQGCDKEKIAFELGKTLVDHGYRVQSGGLGGVMQAVFAGAKSSANRTDSDTIALVPSFDTTQANSYADIVIPTGLDLMRNCLVANADACIAIGGGAGTLCEMSMAWTMQRLLLAYKNVSGWSSRLADTRIDEKRSYTNIAEDRVYGVSNADEAIAVLDKYIGLYTIRHQGIYFLP